MNVKNIIEVLFHSTSTPLTQKDLNHVLGDNKIKLEAGGMSFVSLHDDDSAPFPATINPNSERINFRVLDNSYLKVGEYDVYLSLIHI